MQRTWHQVFGQVLRLGISTPVQQWPIWPLNTPTTWISFAPIAQMCMKLSSKLIPPTLPEHTLEFPALTTQSDAESINAKYVKERSLPRFDILQQIELSIMQTIQDRREQALARLAKVTPDTMQFSVTPWAQSNIHESLKYARTGYDVVVGDIPNTFAVYSLSDRRTRWLVELDSNTCS